MIIKEFLHWAENSDVKSRSLAASALCRAFVLDKFNSEERRAAEGSMAILLEDNSPKVRTAMAQELAHCPDIPVMIANALSLDQIEVAAPIIAYSPVLTNNSLVDLVATGDFARQIIVAKRVNLHACVCAALAEVGDREAVITMLENETAHLVKVSLERLTERFGCDGAVRSLLLERHDLPSHIRHDLIEHLGHAFAKHGLVNRLMGADRARSITKSACQKAVIDLAATASSDDLSALIEHLRISGRLTPVMLIEALCAGHVDFFAAAICSLSATNSRRVQAILRDGHASVISTLYQRAGLDADLTPIFTDATLMWRSFAQTDLDVNQINIAEQLVNKYADKLLGKTIVSEMLMTLETLQLAQKRRFAREYAQSLRDQAA